MKTRHRRKKRRTGLVLIGCMVFVLCGMISYKKIELDAKSTQYKEMTQKYEKELEDLKKQEEEIQSLKDYVQTKAYIEQMAREKLGLVYKGEIIFKATE